MSRIRRVAVTPTLGTDAYTAGDVVGGLMTFRITDYHPFDGAIRSILVTDDHSQQEQYTLYIYNDTPSTIADDAAFAPSYNDLKKLVTTVVVATADWTAISDGSNDNDWALLGGHEDAAMEVCVHSEDGCLYMYAAATDTPDYNAATDLTFTMTVEVF